jgi:ABC-type multidrug transport system fused ATPase/permease subunit
MKNNKKFIIKITGSPLYGLSLIFISLAFLFPVFHFGKVPNPKSPDGTSLSLWATVSLLILIFLLVIGAIIFSRWDSRRKYASKNRKVNIQKLTKSLEESLSAISAIKNEIQEGDRALKKLESETLTQKELANLSAKESSAVSQILEYEFQKRSKKDLLRDILLMIVGVILGTFATIIIKSINIG